MRSENRIPAEVRKSLQDFAVAYFFVFRVQIENAEQVEKTLRTELPKNSLLSELAHGYISGAITEFVLLLYDSADLLKKTVGNYKYKTGGAVDRIFKFRRHILAHRARNWGSNESKETIGLFSNGLIYQACHEAASEFVNDLKNYVSFEPIEKNPAIQKIRKLDFENLVRNSPELNCHYAVPSVDAVTRFFGTSLLHGEEK